MRHGKKLIASNKPQDYQAVDIVTWMLPVNLPHIGIVANQRSDDGVRPLIVHNIGAGSKMEDMIFDYKVTGHYR